MGAVDGPIQAAPAGRVWLPVGGASCCRGTHGLERDLRRLGGVLEASFNPASGIAYVVYDPAVTDPNRLSATMRAAGHVTGTPIGT
ncbi:MAG: heavy-metal-associated domain-containing protein [Chloroflexi bacterium]|nr:heavy-metal-associated domain-containing protein [Chloroflexota bacterium]